jgi:hypothetical protein
VLYVDLQMILQIFPDTGKVVDHVDVEGLEFGGRPDPR